MLATLSAKLPADQDQYAFEWKWDGVRALTSFEKGAVRIDSRNLLDITHQYPELQAIGGALRARSAVLDGEIIALDEKGMPSFHHLQRRMHVASAATSLRLSQEVPAWYMLFDLLYLDGKSLMDEPYQKRRELLLETVTQAEHWKVTESRIGDGDAMLEAARRTRLEGIVAKELDGIYEPGRRSRTWLKVKVVMGQEFVIGGYTPERTSRAGRIGSLLMGYYDESGLQYAGRVGSGLSEPDHAMLIGKLAKHVRASSPFVIDPSKLKPGRWGHPITDVVFVDPVLVAEVEYRRWPAGAQIQQASYKGLREDKRAKNVVKENKSE